jgi:hypothetical protein
MARKYVLVDCCPVPEKLAPAVREVKAATGLRLNSCYRASDAEHLLRQCGKLSQAQLYYRFINGWPGYNPANPPGRSTHECRNDGVAYAGWVGMPLRWWQVGMDWSYGAGAVAAFNRKGYSAALTYPNNSRELHHVNLRKKPFVSIWKIRPLKRGMRSDRVKRVKWMLHVIRDENEKRYLPDMPEGGYGKRFNEDLERAVKRFQRDHDQKVDGVVGFQTKHQLDTSFRYWRRKSGVTRKRLRRKNR